jgi:membrane-associated protein
MQQLLFLSDIYNTLSSPQNIIQIGGIALLLAIIYIETGFFIGLVLPGGDYLVFTAGLLCGSEYLDISLVGLMASMIGAAILGDFTGFTKGRWLGPKLFKKEKSRFFKPSYLEKTLRFYEKYGAVAFIMGRFMPVIRPLIPMLAGSSGYPISKYILMNVSGAIIWIGILTPIGYYIGQLYPNIMDYTFYILFGFVLLASVPALSILFKGKNK